jgi:predicted pyridoxine 5'-phosphate oxidase superfamily flavin-nucleotide-binding protein
VAIIDAGLRSFLEPDCVVSIGTCSDDLTPNGVRGWGPKVSDDGTSVLIFIDRPSAASAVANLRDNGRIAATFVDVRTLRSVQLKGRCVEVGDPQPEDWFGIETHRAEFTEAVATLGYPKHLMRNLWSTQVVKVRFIVEDVFDQTPGPGAGKPL